MGHYSSEYGQERKKYQKLFPRARMHHMHPSSRQGSDQEFNLFPWNEKSHAAWHRLFIDLTVEEVWQLIEVAWQHIWDNSQDALAADWMSHHQFLFSPAVRKDIDRKHQIEWWQEKWLEVFGSDSLDRARCLMRSMMLCMVFGHHAFGDKIFITSVTRHLIDQVPSTGERAWAFRTCFGKLPNNVSYSSVKKQVRKIRACTARARP